MHWKGAAEIILASCSKYIDVNGSLQSIDNDMVGSLYDINDPSKVKM